MMKKIMLISAAALSLCACVQEVLHENITESQQSKLVFEGSFGPETKMAIGGSSEGVNTLVWTAEDAIGIFTYTGGTANKNIKAHLYESSIGQNKGLFIPEERVYEVPSEIEGGDPVEVVEKLTFSESDNEKFFIYFPYKAGAEIEEKNITSSISQYQKQNTLGNDEIGTNGFSTAIAQVNAGTNKATFNLEHQMAYIRFKATSSEFIGYQLHAVQLFDKKGEATLSGEFTYSIESNSLAASADKTFASAKVSVSNHNWSASPEKSELLMTVIPGDYSAADMYVVVTFMNEDGATYTIPMQLDKVCKFPKASLTTIDLGDIGLSKNAFPWYEPYETRDLLDMYAYGSENTYMAEHKLRPTDNWDARPKTEVVIDVKPRGDFSKIAEPKFYKLITPHEKTGSGNLLYLTDDGKNNTASAPAREVSAEYTITLYISDGTSASGSWGVVGVYDAQMELLWSYLVCTYMEGQPVQDITYTKDIVMMDRWLGHPSGSRRCAELGNFKEIREYKMQADSTIKTSTLSGELPYFQWGRKDPFPKNNTGNHDGRYLSVLADDNITIEDGIKNPTTHYGYSVGTAVYDTKGDWHCGGVRNDLWGGYNNTEKDWSDPEAVGHKTIFDPCPAGYRIPDARVLKYIGDNGELWETKIQNEPLQDETYINKNSPFYKDDGGISVIAVKDINGEYDYWSFAGYSSGGSKYGEGTSNDRNKAIMTWANSVSNSENTTWGRAVVLEYAYYSQERHFNARHTSRRAYRYPVRCQKIDTLN